MVRRRSIAKVDSCLFSFVVFFLFLDGTCDDVTQSLWVTTTESGGSAPCCCSVTGIASSLQERDNFDN